MLVKMLPGLPIREQLLLLDFLPAFKKGFLDAAAELGIGRQRLPGFDGRFKGRIHSGRNYTLYFLFQPVSLVPGIVPLIVRGSINPALLPAGRRGRGAEISVSDIFCTPLFHTMKMKLDHF